MKQNQASIKYCWNSMTKMANEQRRIMAYFDSVQARLVSLQELQSATGEELRRRLMLSSSPCGIPSVLDRAFKGEL